MRGRIHAAARCPRAGRPLAFLVALLSVLASGATAQVPVGLQFLGFRPGMPAVELEAEVARLGGTPSCRAARVRSLLECTATLPAGSAGAASPTISLRAVVMHERATIVLLRARLDAAELARWRTALEAAYGAGTLQTSGGQPTRQWIHANTMLRLTTRQDGAQHEVSVSLVDGAGLDGWEG